MNVTQASYRAALLSAGCALNVVDEVLTGQVTSVPFFSYGRTLEFVSYQMSHAKLVKSVLLYLLD